MPWDMFLVWLIHGTALEMIFAYPLTLVIVKYVPRITDWIDRLERRCNPFPKLEHNCVICKKICYTTSEYQMLGQVKIYKESVLHLGESVCVTCVDELMRDKIEGLFVYSDGPKSKYVLRTEEDIKKWSKRQWYGVGRGFY